MWIVIPLGAVVTWGWVSITWRLSDAAWERWIYPALLRRTKKKLIALGCTSEEADERIAQARASVHLD